MSLLNIGVSGLRAQQAALEAASVNVANANTPGYSRQRVELERPAGGLGFREALERAAEFSGIELEKRDRSASTSARSRASPTSSCWVRCASTAPPQVHRKR